MIVVDLNLLLYAVNVDAPQHRAAVRWWSDVLSGDSPVGLPWVVILGFLRLATSPRVFPDPIPVETATSLVDDWMDQPAVRCLAPSERHWPILRDLLTAAGTGGNLTTDAHLAALAIEHGASLASTDTDFARFADLRWRNPLAS